MRILDFLVAETVKRGLQSEAEARVYWENEAAEAPEDIRALMTKDSDDPEHVRLLQKVLPRIAIMFPQHEPQSLVSSRTKDAVNPPIGTIWQFSEGFPFRVYADNNTWLPADGSEHLVSAYPLLAHHCGEAYGVPSSTGWFVIPNLTPP